MRYIFRMATLIEPAPSITSPTAPETGLFGTLTMQPADALLSMIGAYRADPRPEKIDLGVGVFRTEQGDTPVLRAMKTAEHKLLETQQSKSYLGPEGDIGFFEALRPIVFGGRDPGDRVFGLQTPGGTGALRLAAELIALAKPDARVFVGVPTWPNHPPILTKTGLEQIAYSYFDTATQTVAFDRMVDVLETARPGDVALLQACCHNPTGADLTPAQWQEVARIAAHRGILPLLDFAYQGLGEGLEQDNIGVRIMLEQVPNALITYSCDKNFGLYRERTGALYGVAQSGAEALVTQSNLLALARAAWSMPPDHGAAAVRIILEDPALAADWRAELNEMRQRIADMRALVAAADPSLGFFARQHGMFSMLPVSADQARRLRDDFAVYVPNSGRVNVAGLTPANIPAFVRALQSVM